MNTAFFRILRLAVGSVKTGAEVDRVCEQLNYEADLIRNDLFDSQKSYSAIGKSNVSARKAFHLRQIEKRKQLKAITKALTMMPSVSRPSKIKPHHIQYRPKTKSEIFAESICL